MSTRWLWKKYWKKNTEFPRKGISEPYFLRKSPILDKEEKYENIQSKFKIGANNMLKKLASKLT